MGAGTSSSEQADGRYDDAEYAPPESLKSSVVTGVKWKVLSQVLREGSRLGMGILLARLLAPAEWGLASMALVVASLMTTLSDLSLAAALVQQQRITEEDRSTMFWTCLALGVGLTAVGVAGSGLVADFFGEPQLQLLFAVASIAFIFNAIERVPVALLVRDLAFRSFELRQLIATILGCAVAVVLAVLGAGAWAIIGNFLTVAIVSALLTWLITYWRPRLVFSWTSFRRLTGFGFNVFGSVLLVNVQTTADRLLIGRFLGPSALGVYTFSNQLMYTPVLNVAYPLQAVLFPVLATIQAERDRMNAAWLRGKRLTVSIMTPAFMTLLVAAPDLIPTLFGRRWDDSIPIVQLLCLGGVAYSLGTQNWNILMVLNKVGILLRLTLLVTVTVVVAVIVGLPWGIVGVAASFAVAQWLLVTPEIWITSRATGIGLGATFRATCSALPFAFAAAAGGYALRIALVSLEVPAFARVMLVAVFIVGAYLGLAYLGSTPLRQDIRQAVRSIRERRVAAVAGPMA
jgi:O-antigen/teichoic acid export membrane protein